MAPAFRDATRNLRRSPGFSLLAIGTLGIGTTTARVVQSTILRDVPVMAAKSG